MSDLRHAESSGFYVGIRYTGSLKWIESRSSVKLIETFDWNFRTCVAWVHNQTGMWRWSHTTAAEVLFVKHVVSMDTDVVIVTMFANSCCHTGFGFSLRVSEMIVWSSCVFAWWFDAAGGCTHSNHRMYVCGHWGLYSSFSRCPCCGSLCSNLLLCIILAAPALQERQTSVIVKVGALQGSLKELNLKEGISPWWSSVTFHLLEFTWLWASEIVDFTFGEIKGQAMRSYFQLMRTWPSQAAGVGGSFRLCFISIQKHCSGFRFDCDCRSQK